MGSISYCNILKALFYLVKGDFRVLEAVEDGLGF